MADRTVKNPKLGLALLRELMVDPARFSSDEEVLSEYLEPGADPDNLLAVLHPRSKQDVEKVLEVARSYGLSAYTPIPWGLNPPRTGFVIDFKYMADIKGIDTRNLFLEIEPGVTWEQLLPELASAGVRVALPAAAKSPYVLESALEREIVLPASSYANRQFSTFHAVLADGREYRSGADALPDSVSHWREDGGPNISRVFSGSRNSFGIPVRGFIYLYPQPETRKVVVLGLPNRKSACLLAQRAARSEIGTEIVLVNKLKARGVLGQDPGLSTWSVAFGLDGPARLVQYRQKRLDRYAVELKLKPRKGAAKVAKSFTASLDGPWYAPPVSLGFYTNWSRVEELSLVVEKALKAKGKLAQMVLPVKRGASVYLQYDVQDGTRDASTAVRRLLPRLADRGAFFVNPTGSLAAHIFASQPEYLRLLKDTKRFMDPENILNSGQVVEV